MTIDPLTNREEEILRLIVDGLSNQEIARELFLTHGTVKWYASQIYSKLGVSNRPQAIAKTHELNLLEHDVAQPFPTEELRSHLPTYLTSFVGRNTEVAEIKQLLQQHRLVTLSGAGGSGKTRLAVSVASQVQTQFKDGVHFVALAPIRSPELVLKSIVEALEIKDYANRPEKEILVNFLQDKHILIILDNFEHVIAAASNISALLQATKSVSILVTSREVLRSYGEFEYPVTPMPLSKRITDRYSDAMQLFEDRARAVRPNFTITEDNVEIVAKICDRLDGLPLALELAAARMRLFTCQQLLVRLENRLQTLAGGIRDLPTRQQTLRNTIDWSYELLNAEEKTLFARLSIFRGGCNLEAVERVCIRDLEMDGVLAVEALLNKNLIYLHEGRDNEPRFYMLEMIHEYAEELLYESSATAQLSRLHAEYFMNLAEEAEKHFRRQFEQAAVKRLETEYENLRLALEWAFSGNDLQIGLRTAAALGYFWYLSDRYAESAIWLGKAIKLSQEANPILRGRLLVTGSNTEFITNDPQIAKNYLKEAVQIGRKQKDFVLTGHALIYLASRSIGRPEECNEAIELAEEGIEALRTVNHQPYLAQGLNIMGELLRTIGDYEKAREYYGECLEIVQEIGELRRIYMMYHNLSFIAHHLGNYPKALDYVKKSLLGASQLGYETHSIISSLISLAGLIGAGGKPEKAAQLIGAAEQRLQQLNAKIQPGDRLEHEQAVALIRDKLGEENYNSLRQKGSEMTLSQAVEYALHDET